MKILVLAPNGGASLSVGGGTRTALGQAVRFAERGHEVCVAGFHALPREELESLHGMTLPANLEVRSSGRRAAFELVRGLPFKVSAYNILASGAFRSWLERLVTRFGPELAVFHDDLPACAAPWFRGRRNLLYVHFPLAARDPAIVPPLAGSRGPAESWNDRFLHLRHLVVDDPEDLCDEVWSNSSVTARAVESVWGIRSTRVPPVAPGGPPSGPKRPIILSVGAFSRGKNQAELLDAFARAGPSGWSLVVAGHARDARLVRALDRAARAIHGNGHSARVLVDPPTLLLRELFASASVLVHAAEFEPFGIAVVEGMAYGDAPGVRATEFSGPWVDLLDRGRFGWGFRTAAELEERFRALPEGDLDRPQLLARERADELRREADLALEAGLDRLIGPVAN